MRIHSETEMLAAERIKRKEDERPTGISSPFRWSLEALPP